MFILRSPRTAPVGSNSTEVLGSSCEHNHRAEPLLTGCLRVARQQPFAAFGATAKRLWLLTENGAPGRIRTSGPQIRSLVLYPAELRARMRGAAQGRGCGAT